MNGDRGWGDMHYPPSSTVVATYLIHRSGCYAHPEQHLARRVEPRTPAEMVNLLTLDALIATYGMDAEELHDLMLLVRSLYRGGGEVTPRQARFLHDVPRSLDDLAIDASG